MILFYLPTESLLLLLPELLVARIVSDKLEGLEYCPLVGLLNRRSFSTSDRSGRFGVSSCRNSTMGFPFTVNSDSEVYHWAPLRLTGLKIFSDLLLDRCLSFFFSFFWLKDGVLCRLRVGDKRRLVLLLALINDLLKTTRTHKTWKFHKIIKLYLSAIILSVKTISNNRKLHNAI